MASNKVTTRDGVVLVTFAGDQDAHSVIETSDKSAAALDKLAAKGKDMMSLLDMRQIGKVSSHARAAGFRAMQDVRDAKCAIVGAPVLVKHATQFIIRASGKKARVQFFDDLVEAKEWLVAK